MKQQKRAALDTPPTLVSSDTETIEVLPEVRLKLEAFTVPDGHRVALYSLTNDVREMASKDVRSGTTGRSHGVMATAGQISAIGSTLSRTCHKEGLVERAPE